MSSSTGHLQPGTTQASRGSVGPASAPAVIAGDDHWPHTGRPLPWLLAGFLVMIFLFPFDNIIFKVHLPANATLDRVFEVMMIAVFLGSRAIHGRTCPRRRLTPVEIAMLVFGGIALLSIVLNIDRIYQQNQLGFVEKGFSQLLAYGVFFFIVIATVRTEEVPAFTRLVVGLACVTAVGAIYESRSGSNVFYTWSAMLLSPVAAVGKSPPATGPTATIAGPTQHGLALASMLTIALPFAVLALLEARGHAQRLKYLVIIGLIIAGDLVTNEKSATFAPLAAFIVLAAYRREILRWTPLAVIVLIPVIHFAAPGALGAVGNIIPSSGQADYTDGRSSDYGAVAPDILNNLIIGRGYATMDVSNWRTYRILDNQYLDMIFEVGVIGFIAYLAIVACALITAHRVIKRGGVRAPTALAGAAGCAAFGLVSATYDAAGFPQAVYSFLFAAALTAIVASKRPQLQAALPVASYHYRVPTGVQESNVLTPVPLGPLRSEGPSAGSVAWPSQ